MPSKQTVARRRSSSAVARTASGKALRAARSSNYSFHELLQNDVRSSAGDTSGPSQETLQGRVGQEVLEGEFDFK